MSTSKSKSTSKNIENEKHRQQPTLAEPLGTAMFGMERYFWTRDLMYTEKLRVKESKRAFNREKDLLVLPILEWTFKLSKRLAKNGHKAAYNLLHSSGRSKGISFEFRLRK